MSPPIRANLNQRVLEGEKIFFYDYVHESIELPERFRSTRKYIKNVRAKAPRCNKKDFEAELEEFQKSGQDGETAMSLGWTLEPSSENGYVPRERFSKKITPANTAMETTLADCQRVKNLVTDLRKETLSETHWTTLLRVEFFKSYRDVYDTEDENRDLFRRWELHVDLLWNECPSWKAFPSPLQTSPRPDITYLFPIIDPKSKMAKRHRHDREVENFTLPILSELRKREGVIPSPMTGLLNCDPMDAKSLKDSNLACFPWAVVEVSTTNRKCVEFCYCRAAKSSARALVMREELAERIQNPNDDALVVFSFTCVGSSVRFWLTFRNSENENIEMRCIWATSIELTWGVYALRTVIDNMREWVYMRVKPEVARWIQLVYSQPGPETSFNLGRDQGERRDIAAAYSSRGEQSIVIPPEFLEFLSRSKHHPMRQEEPKVKTFRRCIKDDFYTCHARGCCDNDDDDDDDNLYDRPEPL